MNNTAKIKFKEKIYILDKLKLEYVINALDNKDNHLDVLSDEKITKLLEKYNLIDEYFLENVNRL